MPKINNTAPPINNAMMFKGRGAREKLKARTINVMGTTEAKASRSFSQRMVLFRPNRSCHCSRLFHGNLITSPKFIQFI